MLYAQSGSSWIAHISLLHLAAMCVLCLQSPAYHNFTRMLIKVAEHTW
jgi:hypothetical protein